MTTCSGAGRSGPGATTSEARATGLLDWLFGTKPATASRRPRATAAGRTLDPDAFVCSSCGRTDLPETGDWNPPICLECDAAINFDAIEEQEWHEEQMDR